jgi:hypothetical protein
VLLGIHLTLLVGPTVPVPAPATVTEALVGVEVTHTDEGRSGFSLTFQAGRSGLADLTDHPMLGDPLLRAFSRVILVLTVNARPQVLIDGFITRRQLSPSSEPGRSTFTVTGEDVSVMMDMVQLKVPHPAQSEMVRAQAILARYTALLLAPPIVVPPISLGTPDPTQSIPQQAGQTDLAYLTELAGRFGYVFFVRPGLFPGQNIAYWGPPARIGIAQPALSVNMGPATNVDQIEFTEDPMGPTTVVDVVQTSDVNVMLPVIAAGSLRLPPLAAFPAPQAHLPNVRVSVMANDAPPPGFARPAGRGGMTYAEAAMAAQATVDRSADHAVTASGELDALRYGSVLTPRLLVGVRGAGLTHDGLYYVKRVTHSIRPGGYKQRFTITREGVGTTVPAVPV